MFAACVTELLLINFRHACTADTSFKDQMQRFWSLEVNCSLSVFNYNQTHFNIDEDKKNKPQLS